MLVPQGSWLAAIYVLGGIVILLETGSSSVLLYAYPHLDLWAMMAGF